MWHLVCGDAAVEGVRFVLGEDTADCTLRVMRDDLAVGPLQDIDSPPCAARSAYWQGVWPQSMQPVPDFDAELQTDAHWLSTLSSGQRGVTVWHGDSCSEQLLLARVAQALAGSTIELWEVACGNPQLPPRHAAPSRCASRSNCRNCMRNGNCSAHHGAANWRRTGNKRNSTTPPSVSGMPGVSSTMNMRWSMIPCCSTAASNGSRWRGSWPR